MSTFPADLEVFETPEFLSVADNYLTYNELGALKYYLVCNLEAGKPIKEYQGLRVLEFGNEPRYRVIYLVIPEKNTVALVYLLQPNENLPDIQSKDGAKSIAVLKSLVKIGLAVTLREAWRFVVKLLD